MRLINARFLLCAIGLSTSFIFVAPAGALELDWLGWVLDPTFSIQQEFNDNAGVTFGQIAGQGGKKNAGFITTFSPGFLLRRHTKQWQVDLATRLDYNIYTGANLPDRDSERVELRSLYHFNERNVFQFATSYKRDTLIKRISLDIGGIDGGLIGGIDGGLIDPAEDIDIALVGVSVRRNRIVLAPSWQYSLTERAGIGLSYSFLNQTYTKAKGVSLIGTQRHQLTGTTSYKLTPLSTLNFNIDASRRTAENNTQTDNLAFLVGLEHPFSELLTSRVKAGYRITSSMGSDGRSRASTGFVGQLTVGYRTELDHLSGTIGRQLAPSGSGQSSQVDRLHLQYSRSLLPRLSFALSVDAFRAQSIGGSSSLKRHYFDVAPRLRWNWTRWWTIDVGYSFRRRYRKSGLSSRTANSNGVFIAINYIPPPAAR